MFHKSLLFVLLSTLSIAPAAAQIARVKQSVGAAAIERGSARLPASPGLQLVAGDRLVTGKDGRISLTFIDNTRFAIGPNSDPLSKSRDQSARHSAGSRKLNACFTYSSNS